MKPTSNNEAMKKAQSKVKSTADVAKDATLLENDERVRRGEEPMSNLEQRRRQAQIFNMMHGVNNENSEEY